MNFIKTNDSLFFSKNDPHDIRLGEWAQASMEQADLCVVGYPDDEGIAMNGGRTGASKAPDTIRKYFYRMTPHVLTNKKMAICDLGNLNTEHSLSKRHQVAFQNSYELIQAQKSFISLGSGHDYGFSDCAGFVQGCLDQKVKPLIINVDAHLDVRPTDKGNHSGTPFRRLLEEFGDKIDFVEVGIQPQCNSKDHLAWAREQGAHIFMLDDVLKKNIFQVLSKKINLKNRSVFLSFDMDALNSSEAPGCSAVYTSGLNSLQMIHFIKDLKNNSNRMSMGIYEVSPPLDIDDKTSKLAALFMFYFLYSKVK